jgi:pimeloyl-ACP methyl ester carboxylesterase
MSSSEIHKQINSLENKLLEFVGIERYQYKRGNLNHQSIYYIEFNSKKKETILLIHGYGATGITFYKILPALIQRFRVIIIDLPGFGKSDRPNFKFKSPLESLKFFTLPIISLINYLKMQNFIIIAHSFGCIITAHLAKLIKEKILAIFFVAAAGFTYRKFNEKQGEVLLDKFEKSMKVDSKILKVTNYLTFEKKIPILNYISKEYSFKYMESYFLDTKDLNLCIKERDILIDYFKRIFHFRPCGENSLWSILTFGGYCEYPIIDILRENPDIRFFVYYGDQEYLDSEHAYLVAKKYHLENNFRFLKNTQHAMFLQNPEGFLNQFFKDIQILMRDKVMF